VSVAGSVSCNGAVRRAGMSERHSIAPRWSAGPMTCFPQLKLNLHGRGPYDAELKHAIALEV
jgi:hypothetical protein